MNNIMKNLIQDKIIVELDFKECKTGRLKEDFIWSRVAWAKRNCVGRFRYDSHKSIFCFEKEEDAVAFKLYWV